MHKNVKLIRKRNKNFDLKDYQLWLEEKDLSRTTIGSYLGAVKVFGSTNVSTESMRDYIKKNIDNQEPTSLLTMMRFLNSYAKFSKQHIEWEKVVRLIPKHQRKFHATINDEEYKKIKEARFEIEDWVYERNNLMMDFLLYTGVRVSELISIKIVDFQNYTIFNVIGKGNKFRQVFCPEVIGKKVLKRAKKSKVYLFTNYKGEQLTRAMIAQIIQQRGYLSGICKPISPHTFRRTYATRSYNKGTKLTTIQKLLGHTTILTTESYIHNDYETIYDDYSKLFRGDPNLEAYVE